MNEEQIKEQLQLLKGLTVRFGSIHSAQELQLQMWPLVAFPHAASSTAEVNFEQKKVVFTIESNLDKVPDNKSHKRAVAALREWVRNILWDETEISFRWNLNKNGQKRARDN